VARRAELLLLLFGVTIAGLLALSAWTSAVAHAAAIHVTMVNFAFQPTPITVRVGDTVTWTNSSPSLHTTTSTTALWDSGTLAPGQAFSFKFTAAGSFAYRCSFHPSMEGTVTVTTSAPPIVQTSVAKAGTNRLRVTLTARPGQTLERLDWSLPPNAAAEALDGTPLPTGMVLPVGSTSAVFHLRRLSGLSVTLPIVVTGSFDTWNTFVGGGPNAWSP
jgi:plastocyanin